jgi:hypothetical protein
MFARILVSFCLILSAASSWAQGDLRFFGTATKAGNPLAGATVNVQMDGQEIINLTTGKNGKFKFTIDIGHQYKITYRAPGCVDMYMTMDLRVPPEKAWIYPDYVTEIPFFSPGDQAVKTELFGKKPFIKVIFNGSKGFYDDPSYRFVDEILKDPFEDQRAAQAKKDAEDKARKEAEERERLARELELKNQDAERERKEREERDKNNNGQNTSTANPIRESEGVELQREKEERLQQERRNKVVRAQYENNLLKLVAESEKRTNLQRYNKRKEESESNSVVQAMRREADRKAQSDYLIQLQKERNKQQLANKQIKAEQIRKLVETVARIERDVHAGKLKPVASVQGLNYSPHPHRVVAVARNWFRTLEEVVFFWPGSRMIELKQVKYWWSTYYYIGEREVTEKEYYDEMARYDRH